MKELDIVDYIRNKRLSEFSNKVNLQEHQAYFVSKFRRFCTLYEKFDHVMVNDLKSRVKSANDKTFGGVGFIKDDFTDEHINQMCDGLNMQNKYDRQIINEMLGGFESEDGKTLKLHSDSVVNTSDEG